MTSTSTVSEGAKEGHGRHFTIFIEKYETEQAVWTGAQLLALDGKSPQGFQILLKKRGGELEEIKPDQTVGLREPAPYRDRRHGYTAMGFLMSEKEFFYKSNS